MLVKLGVCRCCRATAPPATELILNLKGRKKSPSSQRALFSATIRTMSSGVLSAKYSASFWLSCVAQRKSPPAVNCVNEHRCSPWPIGVLEWEMDAEGRRIVDPAENSMTSQLWGPGMECAGGEAGNSSEGRVLKEVL